MQQWRRGGRCARSNGFALRRERRKPIAGGLKLARIVRPRLLTLNKAGSFFAMAGAMGLATLLRISPASHRLILSEVAGMILILSEVAGMIEIGGLQVGTRGRDFRKRCLRQNLGGDVIDRGVGDLVNEADIPVFSGNHARDDLAPGDLGIDDGLAPAPSIIDHHDEILQRRGSRHPESSWFNAPTISENKK